MTSDLFNSKGEPAFGAYTREIRDIGLKQYRPGLPWALKRFRAKRWRFVGLYSREIVVGIAVVQVGYIGTSFAYVFDMERKSMTEFTAKSPLGINSIVPDHAFEGDLSFIQGSNRILVRYGHEGSVNEVDVDINSGSLLKIHARMDESPEVITPHQIIIPTPGGGFAFTHKSAGLPVEGRIVTRDHEYELKKGEAFGAIDHSAGYHDYHWEWRWASFGGLADDGVRVGLNLAEPAYHPTINENALWVDGNLIPLGEASFAFDPKSILSPWRISTDDGVIDLDFEPLGERAEKIDIGFILSRFHQPVGLFSGTITPQGGRPLTIKNVPGVVEDHEAKW